ncbi:hypothetical protein M404DRAFT_176590 [Pisolithus tinctorius Marx 270]|uniref:Uncharacterized protein n=1 Tax=Pisolithus tinctorius Marx 270 TaxID=870435 RepID=A0A0C3PK06_PISTI|nr:hypothetical protein M404DRAFT_176590 [Pisolithus tinctorius Marx 270]
MSVRRNGKKRGSVPVTSCRIRRFGPSGYLSLGEKMHHVSRMSMTEWCLDQWSNVVVLLSNGVIGLNGVVVEDISK